MGEKTISLEADPTFEQIEAAGGTVDKQANPHTVLDNLFLISGHIPRTTAYETGLKGAVRFDCDENDWFSDELIADERFLMCNVKGACLCGSNLPVCINSHAYFADKGIVVFTGCSHAGVVNTARHAVDLLGRSTPLHAIVGGFHLATSDGEHVSKTVKDLKRLDPAVLLPGHCTGWRAKFAIEKAMAGSLVPCTVGVKITF